MRLLLLMITFLIFGCDSNHSNIKSKLSSDEQLANEITLNVANRLKEKYNLIPCGSGGQMMYEIKMLALSFDYYGPIDIEKGRELLLVAVNEFKDAINADERIRPYLFNYPFEAKNIEIRIFFYKPDGSEFSPRTISAMSAIKSILKYFARNPKDMLLETIHKETYEEAMQKIEDKSKEQVSESILESA